MVIQATPSSKEADKLKLLVVQCSKVFGNQSLNCIRKSCREAWFIHVCTMIWKHVHSLVLTTNRYNGRRQKKPTNKHMWSVDVENSFENQALGYIRKQILSWRMLRHNSPWSMLGTLEPLGACCVPSPWSMFGAACYIPSPWSMLRSHSHETCCIPWGCPPSPDSVKSKPCSGAKKTPNQFNKQDILL